MTLTGPQRRALLIVEQYRLPSDGVGATPFAIQMWVQRLDPERQKYMSSRRMSGYSRKAGAFLDSLVEKGLLRAYWPPGAYSPLYRITDKGLAAIDALR